MITEIRITPKAPDEPVAIDSVGDLLE